MPAKRGRKRGTPKTGGRKRGTLNRATREAREFCVSIIEDPRYQASFRRRAMRGKLAPAVESMVWHYAKGRPVEETKLTIDIPQPLRIELTDAIAPLAESSL